MRHPLAFLPGLALALTLACGGGSSPSPQTPPPPPPPASPKLVYTDPAPAAFRWVRHPTQSTDSRLVLELVGSQTGLGRGVSFAFTVDSSKVQWVAPDATTDLVASPTFDLGSAPRIYKVKQAGGSLEAAFTQKGPAIGAKPLTGVLARVALELKSGATGPVSLVSAKSQLLPESGAPADITLATGTLIIQ